MKINSLSLISLTSVMAITSANAGMVTDFYAGAMFGTGGNTLFITDDNQSRHYICHKLGIWGIYQCGI